MISEVRIEFHMAVMPSSEEAYYVRGATQMRVRKPHYARWKNPLCYVFIYFQR